MKGNPAGWAPILETKLPIGGWEYRVTSDGTRVVVQKKAWKGSTYFRTQLRITMDRWREIANDLQGKSDYDCALTLAKMCRSSPK